MKKKSFFKKLWRFLVDNYFLAIFFAAIAFVGVVSIYKLFFVKPTYVYVKVKVGQGLWWASTQKPSIWFIEGIKQAQNEAEKELTGQPAAKILSIRYYPTYLPNQYDVYLTMRLKVNRLGKTGKYNFKRSAIGVAAPVDFEFPSAQFSGTILQISEKPIKDKLVEKTVILTKRAAEPWEYDSIKIGDYYFNGQEKTFIIIDKTAKETQTLTTDIFGNYPDINPETKKYIFLKAKIKVKKEGSNLLYGEEQLLSVGKNLNIATNNLLLENYKVASIE
jgi:hypothetical protein